MKKNHRYYLLGTVLLLAFAGFSLSSFKETLTPYVSYKQAQEADRVVQVAGALEKGSSKYVDSEDFLYFTLKDPQTKENLRVRYKGLKPAKTASSSPPSRYQRFFFVFFSPSRAASCRGAADTRTDRSRRSG